MSFETNYNKGVPKEIDITLMGKTYTQFEVPNGVHLTIDGEIGFSQSEFEHYREIALNTLINPGAQVPADKLSTKDLFLVRVVLDTIKGRINQVQSALEIEANHREAEKELSEAKTLEEIVIILELYKIITPEAVLKLKVGVNIDPDDYPDIYGLRNAIKRVLKY